MNFKLKFDITPPSIKQI